MTFEQIDALTLDTMDMVLTTLERTLDLTLVPEGDMWFTLDEDEELTMYDRFILHANLTKPDLPTLETELVTYQDELRTIEQTRLDEIQRVTDLTNRFNAITDIRGAMYKEDTSEQNPMKLMEHIITQNDTDLLDSLESSGVTWDNEQSTKTTKENRRKLGAQARAITDELLDTIAGFNIENNLTSEQIDQLQTDHGSMLNALQAMRPALFKTMLLTVTPDGVLVTQDMKDELLDILSNHGL